MKPACSKFVKCVTICGDFGYLRFWLLNSSCFISCHFELSSICWDYSLLISGNEERLAFSVIWEINEDAQILNTHFTKSVIRSRAALTYEQAQLIIDDPSQDNSIAQSLRGLSRLVVILAESILKRIKLKDPTDLKDCFSEVKSW